MREKPGEVETEMAVKSVRSRIRDSLLSQLMSKLEVTEKRDLPKELDDQVKAYLSFYDQFWALSTTLEQLDPTERLYQELSKERRQISATMREILKMFGKLSSSEDSFADPLSLEDLF